MLAGNHPATGDPLGLRRSKTKGADRAGTIQDMAHATKAEKSAAERRSAAIERTSGMFAHLAPGVSLADELVADRRAEVRAEERADEAERRRRGRS